MSVADLYMIISDLYMYAYNTGQDNTRMTMLCVFFPQVLLPKHFKCVVAAKAWCWTKGRSRRAASLAEIVAAVPRT